MQNVNGGRRDATMSEIANCAQAELTNMSTDSSASHVPLVPIKGVASSTTDAAVSVAVHASARPTAAGGQDVPGPSNRSTGHTRKASAASGGSFDDSNPQVSLFDL
jgi:hypothetical protein